MMNAKKFMIGLLTGAMILGATAVPASASFSFNFTSTESHTETTIVTDSRGKEYEVSHVIETVDGETSESYQNVPMEMHNETGNDFVGIYVADTFADTWGDNILDLGDEIYTLTDGEFVSGMTMNYVPGESMIDVKIEMADGTYTEFTEISMDELSDPTHIDLTFVVNENGNYQVCF